MAEETITTERPADAAPAHTTIIRETRSGGGTGIVMALVLLVAIVGGIYLFSQNIETAKDNAIANAASDIGSAATKVGNAAEDAVTTEK